MALIEHAQGPPLALLVCLSVLPIYRPLRHSHSAVVDTLRHVLLCLVVAVVVVKMGVGKAELAQGFGLLSGGLGLVGAKHREGVAGEGGGRGLD